MISVLVDFFMLHSFERDKKRAWAQAGSGKGAGALNVNGAQDAAGGAAGPLSCAAF